MISLESQRTKFNIVISDLERCKNSINTIVDKLGGSGLIYYLCLHDKDKDGEGNLKRKHLHIVIESPKRLRVKQVFSLFMDICETNVENIQIQEVISIVSAVQYLLHINDVNKAQYDRKCLITNQPEQADAYLIETPKSREVTTQILFDLIFNAKLSRTELIYSIGIGAYTHYRNTINDLLEHRNKKSKD